MTAIEKIRDGEPIPSIGELVGELIATLFASQSRRRIIEAWRAGIITREKAAELLRDCGLEDEPCEKPAAFLRQLERQPC